MQYLTVQDIIWINLQLTDRPQRFDYALLEEATYFQYGYGESSQPFEQAARFFRGFSKNRPFTTGNEATAFVGLVTFLQMNGAELDLSDMKAVDWCESLLTSDDAAQLLRGASKIHVDEHENVDHLPEVAPTAREVIAKYPNSIKSLLSAPAVPR